MHYSLAVLTFTPSLAGADLTNAVLDRVDFTKADLTNAKFRNAVITGVVFTDAELDWRSL